jgi:primosomal replication protein N
VNHCWFSGSLVERAARRFTPAGVAVVEAQLQCESEVMEAGRPRKLNFRIGALGIGSAAAELERADLGAQVEVEGFIAPRSRRSARLVLHVTQCRAVGRSMTARREIE